MRKLIKLTESDLVNIVNKVLNEQKKSYNPKNLKLGDRGNDVKELQQKLMDGGFLKTKSMKPTGFFGNMTNAALAKAEGREIPKILDTSKLTKNINQSNKSSLNVPDMTGFIMVFAFPDYRPSSGNSWVNRNIIAPITNTLFEDRGSLFENGSNSTKGSVKMGKLGHGGCIIIQPDGTTGLFEFGRYESDDYGVVKKKDLGKIAKIKNGKLLNAKQVAMIAKTKTQGEGPRLRMDVAVLTLPKPKSALQYADVTGPQEYTVADAVQGGAKNCGTYALEAAIAGGVKTSFSCFATPRGIVDHVRPLAVETFEV